MYRKIYSHANSIRVMMMSLLDRKYQRNILKASTIIEDQSTIKTKTKK